MRHNLNISAVRCVALWLVCHGAILLAETNPMVHREGTHLVDGNGERVELRGVNLGGWFLWEGWMMGDGGFTAESTIYSRLGKLLGTAEAAEFRRRYYDAFITRDDLKRIAAAGFNTIRVPIHYQLLTGEREADGWSLLDRLMDWAEATGLLVVLDLHAALGGQSVLFIADPDGLNKTMWSCPDCRERTANWWQKVAQRYCKRKCVAAYDLLNEPWTSDGAGLVETYRAIIAAIREVDPHHLVMVEGNVLATDFSAFVEPLTENMAYSFHIYTWFGDDRAKRLKQYRELATKHERPLWVGEFGENSYAMIVSTVQMFREEKDVLSGWCFWTWKRGPSRSPGLAVINVPAGWSKTMRWVDSGLFNKKPTAKSAAESAAAFVEAVKLENTQLDERMIDALR